MLSTYQGISDIELKFSIVRILVLTSLTLKKTTSVHLLVSHKLLQDTSTYQA